MKQSFGTLILAAVQAASLSSTLADTRPGVAPAEIDCPLAALGAADPVRVVLPAAPQCKIVGTGEITITCTYSAALPSDSTPNDQPRIVLNRAVLSFETNEESHLQLELTFTNGGAIRMAQPHPVYLVFDDDAGNNYVRRLLPKVDLTTLAPGQRLTFSERLLIGAFRPGRYIISLWIPDPDPSLKFDPAHNFLLSSSMVADAKTGLNTLAEFTVGAMKPPRSRQTLKVLPRTRPPIDPASPDSISSCSMRILGSESSSAELSA